MPQQKRACLNPKHNAVLSGTNHYYYYMQKETYSMKPLGVECEY